MCLPCTPAPFSFFVSVLEAVFLLLFFCCFFGVVVVVVVVVNSQQFCQNTSRTQRPAGDDALLPLSAPPSNEYCSPAGFTCRCRRSLPLPLFVLAFNTVSPFRPVVVEASSKPSDNATAQLPTSHPLRAVLLLSPYNLPSWDLFPPPLCHLLSRLSAATCRRANSGLFGSARVNQSATDRASARGDTGRAHARHALGTSEGGRRPKWMNSDLPSPLYWRHLTQRPTS